MSPIHTMICTLAAHGINLVDIAHLLDVRMLRVYNTLTGCYCHVQVPDHVLQHTGNDVRTWTLRDRCRYLAAHDLDVATIAAVMGWSTWRVRYTLALTA